MNHVVDKFIGESFGGELSPAAKKLVESYENPAAPPAEEMDLHLARTVHGLAPHEVAVPVPIPEESDIEIEGVRVRIYKPQADGPLPVFIYAHGGCWVFCSLETHERLCQFFATNARCIVISVDYTLAPENRFPKAVDEMFSVTRWICENASEFGGDPSRVAIGGDSAGGNLAAVTSQRIANESDYTLSLQVLIYPICAVGAESSSMDKYASGYFFTKDVLDWTAKLYIGEHDPADARISPQSGFISESLAPAFFAIAECDILRDQGIQYAEKLKSAGVKVNCHFYRGMPHAFVAMGGTLEEGKQALLDCSEMLAHAFQRPL
jgi:acetyl esterase